LPFPKATPFDNDRNRKAKDASGRQSGISSDPPNFKALTYRHWSICDGTDQPNQTAEERDCPANDKCEYAASDGTSYPCRPMGLGSALKMRSTPEKTDKEVFGGKLISEQRASFVVRVTYVLTKGCADPQTGKGDAIRDLLDQRPGAPQGRRSDPDSTIPVDHEREGEITCSQ
jgi:hypothetical protein